MENSENSREITESTEQMDSGDQVIARDRSESVESSEELSAVSEEQSHSHASNNNFCYQCMACLYENWSHLSPSSSSQICTYCSDNCNSNAINYTNPCLLNNSYPPATNGRYFGLCQPINFPIPALLVFNESNQPFITREGTIKLLLRNNINIDISGNRAFRVTTMDGLAIAINFNGKMLGIAHPFLNLLQEEYSSHMESGTRMTQINENCIYFKSKRRTLSYVLDTSGCKSTASRFRNIDYDFISEVFLNMALFDEKTFEKLSEAISSSVVANNDQETKCWQIYGIRVRQQTNGDIKISKSYGKITVNILADKSGIQVITPSTGVKISNNESKYLQVVRFDRLNDIRVVAEANNFIFQFGSQKASFDFKDQICIN